MTPEEDKLYTHTFTYMYNAHKIKIGLCHTQLLQLALLLAVQIPWGVFFIFVFPENALHVHII
jgi:hypothetical protein